MVDTPLPLSGGPARRRSTDLLSGLLTSEYHPPQLSSSLLSLAVQEPQPTMATGDEDVLCRVCSAQPHHQHMLAELARWRQLLSAPIGPQQLTQPRTSSPLLSAPSVGSSSCDFAPIRGSSSTSSSSSSSSSFSSSSLQLPSVARSVGQEQGSVVGRLDHHQHSLTDLGRLLDGCSELVTSLAKDVDRLRLEKAEIISDLKISQSNLALSESMIDSMMVSERQRARTRTISGTPIQPILTSRHTTTPTSSTLSDSRDELTLSSLPPSLTTTTHSKRESVKSNTSSGSGRSIFGFTKRSSRISSTSSKTVSNLNLSDLNSPLASPHAPPTPSFQSQASLAELEQLRSENQQIKKHNAQLVESDLRTKSEIENLTMALFEEAQQMVRVERVKSDELAKELEAIKHRITPQNAHYRRTSVTTGGVFQPIEEEDATEKAHGPQTQPPHLVALKQASFPAHEDGENQIEEMVMDSSRSRPRRSPTTDQLSMGLRPLLLPTGLNNSSNQSSPQQRFHRLSLSSSITRSETGSVSPDLVRSESSSCSSSSNSHSSTLLDRRSSVYRVKNPNRISYLKKIELAEYTHPRRGSKSKEEDDEKLSQGTIGSPGMESLEIELEGLLAQIIDCAESFGIEDELEGIDLQLRP